MAMGGQNLVFLVRIADADIPLALVGIIKAVNLPHINQCLRNTLLLQQFGYFVGNIALGNAVKRQAHAFLGKTDFFGIKIDFIEVHQFKRIFDAAFGRRRFGFRIPSERSAYRFHKG